MRRIEIEIEKDGTASINMEGFKGQACENTLKELLVSVGASEVESGEKDEYWDSDDGLMDEIFNNK